MKKLGKKWRSTILLIHYPYETCTTQCVRGFATMLIWLFTLRLIQLFVLSVAAITCIVVGMHTLLLASMLAISALIVEIGRAHVLTPVTNAHLVCRLLLDQQ